MVSLDHELVLDERDEINPFDRGYSAPEAADAAPPLTRGFRLEELQIQNFGTYDGPPSVLHLSRGGAIFTGRNGVGKTTAIDAFRMLISQEPNFNDATTPDAKKRDRSVRTYYQGVIGKLQRDGQTEYKVLRSYEERKFMAVLAIFSNARGRVVSAARLVQYDAQGQGNSQRYVIADARLDIARDFPSFASPRAIRDALAHCRARVYETFNAYRTSLSLQFGVTETAQAWSLFERAIGTKTVDNLTEFMRSLILPASELAETADQLVQSTAALDEAYETVKADEAKIKRLARIAKEIDDLENSFARTAQAQRLKACRKAAAAAVLARAIRRDLKERRFALEKTENAHRRAKADADGAGARVVELDRRQRDLGGQAVGDWRRDIIDRDHKIAAISQNLAKLTTSLATFGLIDGVSFEESHHTASQWERVRAGLRKKADAIPPRTAAMDEELARISATIATLNGERHAQSSALQASERARSNLPSELLEVRERLAEALGVSARAVPFFGELVRVSPVSAREGWEGALNRVLGVQARRLLVPDRLYPEAARVIDGRHLGIRLEYDRVDLVAWQETPLGRDRAAGKLEVRQDSEFAGYVRTTLDRRFDHACFDTADASFRRERRALTKAGQSRDGDRHVKDDRRRVDDRSGYLLGWDTAERVAYLNRDLRRLDDEIQAAKKSEAQTRQTRDNLMIRADQMRQTAEDMGAFEMVDGASLRREIEERQQWIEEATSKNPDYVALVDTLNAARGTQRQAEAEAAKLGEDGAVLKDRIAGQKRRLDALAADSAAQKVSLSIWRGFARLALEVDPRVTIFIVDPDNADVLSVGTWEAIRLRLDHDLEVESGRREKTISTLTRLTSEYLREFTAESVRLATETLAEEEKAALRAEWRQRLADIEGRELVRHRERLQQVMTDAIDNGIVNIKTQLEQEKAQIRDTLAGISETLRAVTYDPTHGTKIRFLANDSPSKRIIAFTRDLRQVTDDWIGTANVSIEERYRKTRAFIDQVRDVPENAAWRREVLDTRRWFSFIAQEYKPLSDGGEETINDYDGASGASGGQKERLAMTVMAAGLAWRFGMVDPAREAASFRVVMLDEAFKNSHDDTTRALLDLFKAFGFQMVFAMPSKNLAVVSRHIERAFAIDTKARRTIVTVHVLKELILKNQAAAAEMALRLAREAGVDVSDLDFAAIDDGLAELGRLTSDEIVRLAALAEGQQGDVAS